MNLQMAPPVNGNFQITKMWLKLIRDQLNNTFLKNLSSSSFKISIWKIKIKKKVNDTQNRNIHTWIDIKQEEEKKRYVL